ASLYDEKSKVDEQLMTIRSKLLEHAEMSVHIKSMLNNVHDNFSIKEIIDSEAYKSAALAFE
ncbi:hypothetical protein U4L12_28770, partial [Klebsiella pneumoniae]|nr:hypothetical protein [Klebsiella pneumoniae]